LGQCRDLEVILDGPAGTGKTYAALYKIHVLLLSYPGAKALVARKTNTSLAGSAMATFREMLDPREGVRFYGGSKVKPAAYEYPNGSLMIVQGLDRPEKIKSFEFDLCFVNEITELTLEDWEFIRSRLRHGATPYHQMIADANPVEPTHWANTRMNDGLTTRLLSRHEHNPRFFDIKTGDWTEDGRHYIFEVLGGLTGVRLSRLRYGLWVAASGTVYEGSWDRAVNVIDKFPIPRSWQRFISIDFGFTHPFVALWGACDEDGRIYIYRQLYKTKTLVEDHAHTIAEASGWFHLLPKDHPKYNVRMADWADPLPREIICDHDAEDRHTLQRHLGLYTIPAKKSVSDGIQAVAARFRLAGDGKPRLMIMRDSLIERDMELARMKRPTCVEEEPDGYVFKQDSSGAKEEPVKESDDGLDCIRYLVAYHDLMDNNVSYYRGMWK
jgi:PBSX family phage terminase large subunit